MPGVIIGLVRPPAVDGGEFLRWSVVDAGDALLALGDTVETMTCTEGSVGRKTGRGRRPLRCPDIGGRGRPTTSPLW